MWDVLGLEPTMDRGAVRRAYAARLKQIDVDRDPAAFIRLREAYESCLRWEEPNEGYDDVDWDWPDVDETASSSHSPSETETAEVQAAPVEPSVDLLADHAPDQRLNTYRSVEAYNEAFAQAWGEGRFEPLARLYIEGLVNGQIPVGQEQNAHAVVVRRGAEDMRTPFAEIRRFAEAHAWEQSRAAWLRGSDDFGEVYAARRAAEDWLEEQTRLSRPQFSWIDLARWLINWSWLGPSPARAAQVLLGRIAPWRLREEDAPQVQASLEALRRHAPYLGDRFNSQRTAQLEKRVEFLTRKGFLIGTWRFMLWFAAMAVKLILALALFIASVLVLLAINDPALRR